MGEEWSGEAWKWLEGRVPATVHYHSTSKVDLPAGYARSSFALGGL